MAALYKSAQLFGDLAQKSSPGSLMIQGCLFNGIVLLLVF